MPNFVPFLLIVFLIAALLRMDFFFTIAYLFFAIYLLARLWTRRTVDHLHVQRRFTDHAFTGDQVTVDVNLSNTGWLPIPWLEVHESLPVELTAPAFHREVVTIDSHASHRLRYALNCRRRGYYPIGPLKMQTGDLLGIVGRSQMEVASQHIIVYPRVVPLQRLGLPTRSPLAVLPARSPLFEDPTRIMGVRDYQRGDSPRRIHWTATASTGRLVVKRYQPAIARETLICLNLDQADYRQRQRYTATELAIVVAASIANHIIVREGLPVGLITEAWDPLLEQKTRFSLPPRTERAHLMSLLEVLARVQVAETTPFVDFLRRESVNLPWGATFTIITGRESEALFDTLAYLRRIGLAVTLILVQSGRPSGEWQRRTDLLGVPIHRVWKEQDLEAWG
jgi:uncharacterized protein (DUF58 family)